MPFRFRRSARVGPLRFNFGKSGLSSISLGGPGACFNIPVARSGGARTTVGLPGTGLSWSVELSPEANRLAAERLPAGPAERLLMMSNDHGPNGKKQPYWIGWEATPVDWF